MDTHPKTFRKLPYPTNFSTIGRWAEHAGLNFEQALNRFVAYSVLESIATNDALNQMTILRGSAALWLHQVVDRSIPDFDFTCSALPPNFAENERDTVIQSINVALTNGLRKHFPNWERWRSNLLSRIKIELVPLLYPVTWSYLALGVDGISVRVADPEFVIAEKLVAVVNPRENRSRAKDFLDFAAVVASPSSQINYEKLRYLVDCVAYFDEVDQVRRANFNEKVKLAAQKDFHFLAARQSINVPFEELWSTALDIVTSLEEASTSAEIERRQSPGHSIPSTRLRRSQLLGQVPKKSRSPYS